MTDQSGDGTTGADNVAVLFPDRPSAQALPPQPDIIATLESYLAEARSGKTTGLIVLGFDPTGGVRASMTGRVPLRDGVTALEQFKFGVLARDYAGNIMTQIPPKP